MASIHVTKPVMITLDAKSGGRRFEAGIHHDVDDAYAEHWYAKANGVLVLSSEEVEALTALPPAPIDVAAAINARLGPIREALSAVLAEMGDTADDHAMISVAALRALALTISMHDPLVLPTATDGTAAADDDPAAPVVQPGRRRKA